jgi:hypothetical protein
MSTTCRFRRVSRGCNARPDDSISVLVASKFGTSLAHAAELPGNLRLEGVDAIYYPGLGLVCEFGRA